MKRTYLLSLGLVGILVSGFIIEQTITASPEKPVLLPRIASLEYNKERGDVVKDLYMGLMDKDNKLRRMEDHMRAVDESRIKLLEPFIDYNQRNESYYKDANAYADKVADAELRKRLKELLAASQAAYQASVKQHNHLLAAANSRMAEVQDLHKVLKVVQTLPLMEQYQHKELPATAPMQKYVDNVNGLAKHLDSLAGK
jgi:hypothetical protein